MRRGWAWWLAATLLAVLRPAAAAQAPLALTADSVRVVYWPGDEGIARRTLQGALAPLRLPGVGVRPGLRAGTVVLAPDAGVIDSITGGYAPDWAAGVAIPSTRTIILPAFPSARTLAQDPITALRHELVHLALDDHLGVAIPRWFSEGYATWASGEFDRSAGWQIRLALLRGAAPPLDSITLRWPASAARARLAYLLSASAVEYLANRNGERAFAAFLRAWREERSIDAAMRSTYLITLGGFEQEWRTMVRQRYGWLLAIAQIGFFWGALTILFLALGLLRRRRDRARLEAMRADDRLHPPEEEAWLEAEEAGGADGHSALPPYPDDPPPERLAFPARVEELRALASFVDGFATRHRLPHAVSLPLRLALDELVTNVIAHGYDDEDPGGRTIVVRLWRTADAAHAEIRDDGRPFDPRGHPGQGAGGRGIHFARSLVDGMAYAREGGENRLVLTRRIPAGG